VVFVVCVVYCDCYVVLVFGFVVGYYGFEVGYEVVEEDVGIGLGEYVVVYWVVEVVLWM